MNKMEVFFKKHSSTILTVLGSAGVVATSVLAVRATPKAMRLIEEEKQARTTMETIYADNEPYLVPSCPKLTKLEIVKVAWKPYIPAAITGISTIACIFGINLLSTKNQASLMSAYAILDSSYKQYREKVKELYGEDSDINVKQEIAKDNYDEEDFDFEEEGESFFDFEGVRWFKSSVEEVREAERKFNEILSRNGVACLNEFYDILGVSRTKAGYNLGWSTLNNDTIYGYTGFEIELEKTEIEGGMECWIMTMTCPPSLNYLY